MRRLLAAGGGGGGIAAPANVSLTPPIRAAYYFPWYPEVWSAPVSIYTATLGLYDQADVAVIDQHMAWLAAANFDAVISVWEGRADGIGKSAETWVGGGHTDRKLSNILDRAQAHGLKVFILYEVEANGSPKPTVAEIQAELAWMATHRFNHPAYLHVDGRPVLLVYSGWPQRSDISQVYSDATSGFTTAYVLLQFEDPDPSGRTPQPDGWFSFDGLNRTAEVSNTYQIKPGFHRSDEMYGVLSRDLPTWEANIASMVASGADWHLVNSFNEFGEGTVIEPTVELGTDYIDALAAVP